MARGKKTGGRTKGTPNKITGDLRALIMGALEEVGGQDYLVRQAWENPGVFVALLGKALPRDFNLGGGLKLEVNLVGIQRSIDD
jgi:hypothetical protein